jgi:pimeloyl-ACP methyl ester carboxylesterase
LSRLLEPAERSVVLGDLVESGASGTKALREIGGLVGRRQAALWLAWDPWIALLVAVPLGVVLSFVSRWWAQGNALGLADYNLERLTWEYLQHPAARRDLVEFVARLFLDNVALIAWSWGLGFVIGTVSSRTRWVTAGLFSLILFMAAAGTTTTGQAFRPGGGILGTLLIGTVYPLLLRVIVVLLPLEWGMQASRRRAPLPRLLIVVAAIAIVALTAFEARAVEGALTFGAGVLPAAGPDRVIGSLDDGRPWWWVPIVMTMPAMYMAATVLRPRHRSPA